MSDAGYDSFNNSAELASARVAGCFSCLAIFEPADVVTWTHGGSTAVCPLCSADTVLPHVGSLAALRAVHAGLLDNSDETIPAVLTLTPERN
ncbi:hypothetical protein [Methylibium sp.]|jgi:hypothetical protein|uniref:hypothetical protein n=1 Tax=Methylibium sp. TaxID=2067992 RepID=UPI003D096D76